jgi:hypothetical protein
LTPRAAGPDEPPNWRGLVLILTLVALIALALKWLT